MEVFLELRWPQQQATEQRRIHRAPRVAELAATGRLGIKVNMGGGNDAVRIDDTNGAFTDSIPTTIAGGAGDDSLIGGAGAETFQGGDGNDTIDGRKGNDTAYLGGGNDVFTWDPGEGSDVIDAQGGRDRMLFNGAAGADTVTLTANFGRLTFFRDPGNVTMDTDDVETVDFNALGGPDSVTVNDLTDYEADRRRCRRSRRRGRGWSG